MKFSYRVEKQDTNFRLDEFLASKYTYYSLDEWQNQIRNGNILINEKLAGENLKLEIGEEISFTVEDFLEPEVDKNYSIVYEDEYLFAVNKSGNIPVHPAGRYRKNNLTTILENDSRINKPFHLAHRLDRETSGIVLFGKSKLAANELGQLFSKNKIKKTYLVYVEGIFPESISAKGFLAKDENSKIRKKKKFTYSKEDISLWDVHTDFELIKFQDGVSKIKAFPHTGKIHQIRATLFSIGFPLIGDKIYGKDESIFLDFIETGKVKGNFPIARQALHASNLSFIHPFYEKQIVIGAEEPEDMKRILLVV